MSKANVEIVRQGFQAFNDRDFDAMLANYAEDVEYRLIGRFADLAGAELRGRAAVRDFLSDWVENVGGRGEMETVLEAADDRVVVIIHSVGAGSTSGAPATMRWAQVYTFRRRSRRLLSLHFDPVRFPFDRGCAPTAGRI